MNNLNNMNIDQIFNIIVNIYGNAKFINLSLHDKAILYKISNTDDYLTSSFWSDQNELYKYNIEHKYNDFGQKYNYRKLYIISHIHYIVSKITLCEEDLIAMLNYSIIKCKLNKKYKLNYDATILDYITIFEFATIKQMFSVGI